MEKHEIICVGSNDIRKFRVKKTTCYMDWLDEAAQLITTNVFAEIIYKIQVKIFGIWFTIRQYKSHKEEDDEYLCKCSVGDYNKLID